MVLGLGVLGVLLPAAPLLLGGVALLSLVLGAVVLPLVAPLVLGDVLLSLVLGGVVLPVAPALDLKCASHSAREICPSLFVSTIEKLGSVLLAPLEALLPVAELPLDMPEDELVEGVALGDLSGLPEAPVDDEPELWAMDTLAIAKSAAAVAVPTNLSIWTFLLHED